MKFECMFPWALEPTKAAVDVRSARSRRELLRNGFSTARAERQPEFCPPWVQGQTLGWRIHSPIDVELSPLHQTEIAKSDHAGSVAAALGHGQVWVRGETALAVSPTSWLNGFEYVQGDERHNMFIPNGLGTAEWRLGWRVQEHGSFGLLIMPSGNVDIGVEVGYFSPTMLERLQEKGLSIAIRPSAITHIRRDQEIAWLIPIHPDAAAL